MRKLLAAVLAATALSFLQSAVADDLKFPTKMCDGGVISAGSDTYSFEDIVVDGTGAIDLNDHGPIAVYGYIADVDFGPELNDRINAKVSTIDVCYENIGVVQTDTKVAIDLVLTPDDFTDATAWKDIRRTMLRLKENMVNANSLVKLDGQFGIYENTFGLYFRAKSVDVIDSFKTRNDG